MNDGYRSIFSPATRRERAANFEAYWAYTVEHDGEILEDQKGLIKKQQILTRFQSNPVRSCRPLPDAEGFYRNYVTMQDDPRTLDRKTLLLTFLYKFARHEFVGISAAWGASSRITESTSMIGKIGRYHLCEEFSHMRLFPRCSGRSASTRWTGSRSESGWAACTDSSRGSRSRSWPHPPS